MLQALKHAHSDVNKHDVQQTMKAQTQPLMNMQSSKSNYKTNLSKKTQIADEKVMTRAGDVCDVRCVPLERRYASVGCDGPRLPCSLTADTRNWYQWPGVISRIEIPPFVVWKYQIKTQVTQSLKLIVMLN